MSRVPAATALWRGRRHALGLSLGWSAAFVAPLAFSPGPMHRYYLAQAGYILLYSLAGGVLARDAMEWWKARNTTEPAVDAGAS